MAQPMVRINTVRLEFGSHDRITRHAVENSISWVQSYARRNVKAGEAPLCQKLLVPILEVGVAINLLYFVDDFR